MRLVVALACAAFLASVGCGGATADAGDSGPGDDAGVAPDTAPPDTDAAAPDDASVTYPADHTPMPIVPNNGGRILQNPEIVTVTFAGDDPTMVSRVQQFDDIITTTAWWSAVSAEYCDQPGNSPCIGPGSSGGHVVISDTLASQYIDSSTGGPSSLQDFIRAHVVGDADAGITADLPPVDDNTLYVFYFPPNVTITLDGQDSCSSFGAYHNTMILPNKSNVDSFGAYAIIPRCGTKESTTTISASHEIIEAATDPDIGENSIAYYLFDTLWGPEGGEVGDLCEGFGSGSTTESTFTVQRIWSNKSGAASHSPCVPIPNGEVYFNAAPRQSKVVLPKAGASAVVDIDVYSDAPKDPWTLSVLDYAAFQGGNSGLTFKFDKTSVQNGDHVQLTVTASGTLSSSGDQFAIESKDSSGARHSWPMLAALH